MTSLGLQAKTAANADEALATLRGGRYDLAVVDVPMPGRDGLWLATEVQREPEPCVSQWPATCFPAPLVRSLSRRFVGLFASPLGVFGLAALDGTLFFSLPFGIDAVVIILSARLRGTAWMVPLLATAGSVTGAALTFWMGVKIGDAGLERYVSPKRLEKIREHIRGGGAVALAALSIIPPPFPFTPFVLAAGALDVRTATFFTTFFMCRLARFGLEALLAVWYGRRILQWLESDLFQDIVVGFIVLAAILTTVSVIRVIRSTKPTRRSAAA